MKKQFLKTIGSTLMVGAFLFLAFGSDDSESSSSSNSNSSKKEEMVTCCCCDGGKRVVYYHSKLNYLGQPSGTDYDRPKPCPCCDAMKGDYENAKVTKTENEELKRTSNHCK